MVDTTKEKSYLEAGQLVYLYGVEDQIGYIKERSILHLGIVAYDVYLFNHGFSHTVHGEWVNPI